MALQQAGIILVAQNYAQYMAQLRAINAAQQQTFSGGAQVATNVRRQTQAFSGLTGALGTVKSAMGALTAVYGAFMAIDAVRGLKQFMDASLQVAMRNETLAVSLQVVGKNAGYSAEQIAYATAAVKAQGITSQAAMQSLLRMAQANIEFADAAGLARIAQDAAVIGNINSSEAFERMIYGIQSGQVEVLKTIGINVTFEQSYRDMAKQLGKNRMELSEVDKAQARTNAVMEAGKRIAGTYEAAMATAGKQQQSLARYIENTQENLGNLLLPFEQVKVAMELGTWKGLEEATRGLKGFSDILKVLADDMTKGEKASEDWAGTLAIKMLGAVPPVMALRAALLAAGIEAETTLAKEETLGERFGRVFNDLPKIAAMAFSAINASIYVTITNTKLLADAFTAFKTALTGDLVLAKAMMSDVFRRLVDLGDDWETAYKANMDAMVAKFPSLLTSYDELAKTAEVDLTRVKTATELATEALQKQADSLSAVMDALMQVEKIQNAYDKGRMKAVSDREKSLAKLEIDSTKSRAQATQRYNNDMAKLDNDYNRQVADIRAKGAIDAKRATEDLNRELKRMDRDYKLSKLQSDRGFALDEKWLMAEGDVLGLMRLREQHALEQQTAAENFSNQRSDAVEDAATTAQRAREDQQQQIEDLRKNLEDRRAELTTSYQNELKALSIAQEERRVEIDKAYADQLQALSDSRDEQLKLLGESLKDAGVVTQAGMTELEGILNSLFGENKAGDALVKGWTDRGESAITAWADTLSAKIAAIEARMKALTEGTATPTAPPWNPTNPLTPVAPIPMRSGGSGVVTGPAKFAVEPGQREFVSFVPMGGRSRDMNINATVAGGIDIRGAEGASAGVVDTAVRVTMTELREAIRRMSKN